jgi:hypothetical protein
MKKVLLIVVASAALIALVPATALAKHGDRRHHRGHHHAQVHHRTFGHDENNQNNNTPAGTVVSFTNGVLTIVANDGNTASGKVTNATEIKCEQQEPAEFEHHDRGRGDDGGDDNDRGDDNGNDQGDNDNDNDNDKANEMCTTADLTKGAVVQKAELRITSAGGVWDEVELVSQPSNSSSNS